MNDENESLPDAIRAHVAPEHAGIIGEMHERELRDSNNAAAALAAENAHREARHVAAVKRAMLRFLSEVGVPWLMGYASPITLGWRNHGGSSAAVSFYLPGYRDFGLVFETFDISEDTDCLTHDELVERWTPDRMRGYDEATPWFAVDAQGATRTMSRLAAALVYARVETPPAPAATDDAAAAGPPLLCEGGDCDMPDDSVRWQPTIRGRGFTRGRVLTAVRGGCAVVRGDCDEHPESWVEIRIGADTIRVLDDLLNGSGADDDDSDWDTADYDAQI